MRDAAVAESTEGREYRTANRVPTAESTRRPEQPDGQQGPHDREHQTARATGRLEAAGRQGNGATASSYKRQHRSSVSVLREVGGKQAGVCWAVGKVSTDPMLTRQKTFIHQILRAAQEEKERSHLGQLNA